MTLSLMVASSSRRLRSRRRGDDERDIARLLAENPTFKEEDIADALAYYRRVMAEDPTAADAAKEFPQTVYKRETPWAYQREVNLPGGELVQRLQEDGSYGDVKTPFSERLTEYEQQMEEALGPKIADIVKQAVLVADDGDTVPRIG
jgi:hypothetical protein